MYLIAWARTAFALNGLLSERMGWRPLSVSPFLLTLSIVAAATGLQAVLSSWFIGAPFLMLFPAVVLVTLLCGFSAGVLGMALCVASAHWLIGGQDVRFREFDALVMFTVVAAMNVAVISALLAINLALKQSLAQIGELNDTLVSSDRLFRDLLESAPDAMVIADKHDRIVLTNAQTEALFGYTRLEMRDRPIEMLMPLRYRAAHVGHFAAYAAEPKIRHMGDDLDLSARRKNGDEFPVEVKLSPLRTSEGQLICSVIRDVSRQRAGQRAQDLMIHELNHRVKNTLANVQAIVQQTLVTTETPEAFAAALNPRLEALATSHNILSRRHWQGMSVRELVTEQVHAFQNDANDRIEIYGPDVNVSPNAAVALGMAIGELVTNAAKHGALSRAEGRVRIDWERVAAQSETSVLRLTWRESGGPPVNRPTQSGFGLRMLERALPRGLKATTRLSFELSGLVCRIEFDLNAEAGSIDPNLGVPGQV